MVRIVALLVAVAACSSSSEAVPQRSTCGGDQQPTPTVPAVGAAPDFSCKGKPSPSLGCDELKIEGRIVDLMFNEVGLPDGAIEVFDAADKSLVKIAAGDDGRYSVRVPIAGPFGGRVMASVPDRWNHDAYFSTHRLSRSTTRASLGLATLKGITAATAQLSLPAPNPAKAFVDPWAFDCAGNAIHDATIEIDRPYEKQIYVSKTDKTDLERTTTDAYGNAPGGTLFINVDPGPINVTVKDKSGAVIARGKGVARAAHWTAIFTAPE